MVSVVLLSESDAVVHSLRLSKEENWIWDTQVITPLHYLLGVEGGLGLVASKKMRRWLNEVSEGCARGEETYWVLSRGQRSSTEISDVYSWISVWLLSFIYALFLYFKSTHPLQGGVFFFLLQIQYFLLPLELKANFLSRSNFFQVQKSSSTISVRFEKWRV